MKTCSVIMVKGLQGFKWASSALTPRVKADNCIITQGLAELTALRATCDLKKAEFECCGKLSSESDVVLRISYCLVSTSRFSLSDRSKAGIWNRKWFSRSYWFKPLIVGWQLLPRHWSLGCHMNKSCTIRPLYFHSLPQGGHLSKFPIHLCPYIILNPISKHQGHSIKYKVKKHCYTVWKY